MPWDVTGSHSHGQYTHVELSGPLFVLFFRISKTSFLFKSCYNAPNTAETNG